MKSLRYFEDIAKIYFSFSLKILIALYFLLVAGCAGGSADDSSSDGFFLDRFNRLISVPPINRVENVLKETSSLSSQGSQGSQGSSGNHALAGERAIVVENLSVYDPCTLASSLYGSVVIRRDPFPITGNALQQAYINGELLESFLSLYSELCSLKYRTDFLQEVRETELNLQVDDEDISFERLESAEQDLIDRLNEQSELTFSPDGSIGLGFYSPGTGSSPAQDTVQKTVWTKNRIKHVYDGISGRYGGDKLITLTFERSIDGDIDHSKIRLRSLRSNTHPGAPLFDNAVSFIVNAASGTAIVRYAKINYSSSGDIENQKVVTYQFFSDGTAIANSYLYQNTGIFAGKKQYDVEDTIYMEYRTMADGKLEIIPLYHELTLGDNTTNTPASINSESITASLGDAGAPAWGAGQIDRILFPELSFPTNHSALETLVESRLGYLRTASWEWPRTSSAVQDAKELLRRNGVPDHATSFKLEADFLSTWDSEDF